MFDEHFLQNMGVLGSIENARLQQKVREQEAEIERLKAKLKIKVLNHIMFLL